MAEYYPLLAKAVASLPNSTQDSRKVVYERARKALIGQLRTLHPPVPDEDIARESDALDRAVERLETELATPPTPIEQTAPSPAPFVPPKAEIPPAANAPRPVSQGSSTPATPSRSAEPSIRFPAQGGALGPSAGKPFAPLRTKLPLAKPPAKTTLDKTPAASAESASAPAAIEATRAEAETAPIAEKPIVDTSGSDTSASARDGASDLVKPSRPETQRPFAPQPPKARGVKRPLWIIPLGIAIVILLVGVAAYKLRDKPNLLTRAKPADQTADASKIVERVGGEPQGDTASRRTDAPPADASRAAADQIAGNPAAAVAGRAALLVEAPDDPANKVKTYLGTVVWRLDNVSDGQNQAVGLAVRADIDLPDDRLKATVLFQKNVEASLPASHTMKVRFMVQPGSATGNVKQINVPQMRKEDSATGDSLDGVSVTIVDNSFLIGLTPGNSEAANLDMLRAREWIDIPILLTNSKIAKLTFEKTAAGQRDLQEAIAAWTKQ